MQDIPLPSRRTLTETERQAFTRLGLTPGHLAALVVAPLISRRGARGLLPRSKHDIEILNRLRLQLRTVSGMSKEAEGFWNRAFSGLPVAETELAQRLLAWHLATDLSYPRRAAFYDTFWTALEHFGVRAGMSVHDQFTIIMELYRFVDQYLPVATFTPHEPSRVVVSVPPRAVLDAVARYVVPTELPWPLIDQSNARFRLPVTVSLFGESIREWWFKSDAPRRAAANGMASLPFEERERLYKDMQREWQQVFQTTHGKGQARNCADQFVSAVREWVDGVRSAMRLGRALWAEAPPPDPESVDRMAAPIVVASPPAPPAARVVPPPLPPPPPAPPAPVGDPALEILSSPPPRVAGARELHPVHIPISPPPAPPPEPPVAPPIAHPPAAPRTPTREPTRESGRDPSIPADSFRIPASVRQPAPPPLPKPKPKPEPERVTARRAELFEQIALDDALERARAVSVDKVCAWVESATPLLFDDCREETSREVVVVRTENAVPNALWVVGDLHADVLTLANIIAYANSLATPEQPPHFLFLGDFVDRGTHDHEALLLLFHLLMEHPDRVCVVPGNHDIDLQYDETAKRFRVTIEPAEYCEALNAALKRDTPEDRERIKLARAFIRFCAGRPNAVFLPDGTLFTHGGFPHTDVQKDIAALPDLCKPRCLDDFLWARIAESARVKRPNRGSRGHEFGWDTLIQFCKVAAEKLDVPVKRLVRGHDHVTDRWMEYPDYADNNVPVLTINAMGRLLDGEPARRDGHPHPFPVVGRYVPNHLPEVIALPLDPTEVDRAFPRSHQRTTETGSAEKEPAKKDPVAPEPTPERTDDPRVRGAVEEHGPDRREPGAEAAP